MGRAEARPILLPQASVMHFLPGRLDGLSRIGLS
jgi:hypothetical protein